MTGAQIERARAQARGRHNTVGETPLSQEESETFEEMLQVGRGCRCGVVSMVCWLVLCVA